MVAPRKPRPPDIDSLLQAAYQAYVAGRRDEAENALRGILEIDPANTAAWNNLASLLSESGRNVDAEAAYRKAIALNPDFPDFHSNLGNLLRATGRPAEAEDSYRRAIRLDPKDASNLALLAQLLKETGATGDAEKLFRQALVLDPSYALGHNNLGILLNETGRTADAESAYRRALMLNPAFPEAHNNLGIVLLNDERFDEAEAAFRRAIELQPDLADAHSNLGNVLKRTERLPEAESSYRRALGLQPGFAEAHNNLGLLLKQAERPVEAEAAYRSALELKPGFAEAHNNLGILLFGEERLAEAEAAYRRAIELKPDLGNAYGNLGNLLKQVKRLDEAEAAYRQAIAIDPDDAGVYNNLAILLSQTRRMSEAETAFRRAIELKPEFTEAHSNFGNLLKEMGRLQDAEAAYRRALELKPDHTDTKLNLGILLLTLGRYGEGWPNYNAGHTPDTKARRDMRPPFSFPEWQGEALAGKSLVVVIEQGAGDNVQFVRYAPLLKAHGLTRLSYFQPGAFIPLLATAHGIDLITPDSAAIEAHDYWSFPLSLPQHLGTMLDSIPDTLPYLWALPERVEKWRARLPASGPGGDMRVGLVWKGNPDHMNDANRSLPHLSVLAPLWQVPGISFVSLQKGQGEDEARQPPPGQPLLHLGDDIADFADTAAIVAQLDLVISVDSAAAHVAGALGKPVWVLLPGFGTDWRWLLEREDSPWYPGAMRLFRQPHDATSWDDTVARLATALRSWCAAPPPLVIPVSDHGAVAATLRPTPAPAPAAPAGDPYAAALAAFQAGRHDEAESILRRMLTDNPGDAGGWNNLGNLLQETGRLREAEAAFGEAITLVPDQPSFHGNLGNLLVLDGRSAEAEDAYRRAIELDPDNAASHNQLGSLLNNDGRPDEAEAAYRRAIELAPDYADAHNNLGILFKDAENREDAEAAYRRALELNPGFAEAHNNLGILLLEDERFAEAEAALRRALELKPDFPDVHSNLGNVLKQTKRLAEAETCYRRAMELKPTDATAHNNLGVLLHEANRLDDAGVAYRHALELNPDFADAHSNLGILLQRLGRFGEAEAAYRRAIELNPGCTDAKLNLGLMLLALGRYAEAWPWHEARHFPDNKARRAMQPPFSFPQWQGEPLAGKSLVVVLEQGAGDNIQFVRYGPLLKAQGLAHLTFIEPTALVPLLATASGVDAVLADVSTMPPHDYWCFPLSLPFHLGTTLDNIPDTLPYLWALHERVEKWRARLPASGPGGDMRVGLVWKGNPDHKNDANRSLPHLSVLAPLWQVPGISFVSLQKGQGEDEARQPPPGQPLLHLGDDIADFADTAAIVAQLDLVISVDSAAAHVAGALGKPVWVLLPGFGTDWRWLLEREDSPWYPGAMRLFRQPHDATSWDGTVARLAAALRSWADAPPPLAVPLTRHISIGAPAVVAPETEAPAAPAGADALMEAARVAYVAGRRDEAANLLREALAIDDGNPVAWTNLAGIFADAGSYAEAEAAYRKGMASNPGFAELHVNFARYLEGRGRHAEAESAYRAALTLRPDDVALHNNLGVLLFNAGRLDEAEPYFRGAASREPGAPTYWNNLGNVLRMQRRPTEAEAAYRQALALLPDDNQVLNNIAVVLGDCGRDEEALVLLRRITTLVPYFPDGWNNLGTSLQKLGRHREAEAAYGKAIAIHPGFAAAHANLGNLLDGQRRLAEAEAEYRRATVLDPGFISAHWNLALLMLNQGRWAEAWPWFERRNDPFRAVRNETFGCPEWQGEDLAGKSLLIDSVEGQGDNIMCARYIPLLKRAGATRITLIHRAPLKPLLETVEGVDAVVQEPPPQGRFDYWCFSFSLLTRFATTPETIPATIPYLVPLASRMSYWQRKLEPVKGFRVGLVWKGDPVNDVDRHRSLPHLSTLAPLWKIPGVSFVSLQKGQGEDEAKPPPPEQPLVHLGDDITDFADTAAIISQLDLLITVDTAPAHVAGALGKPVWVLIPAIGTDWRWLRERDDTPWYPGAMRLFRQLRDASDWQAVVDDIASALAAKVTGSPEPVRAPPPAASPPPAETALRPAILTDSPQEPSMTRPALRPAAFVLASSDHGTLIVNRNDYADTGGGNMIGVGCQVLFNSSFDRDEVDLALRMLDFRRRLFGDGVMALDCGANIGVHTVEWAKQMHGWGSVIAVEAQERVFYALAGNITINNCFNARAIWGAVGAENGEIIVPRPDYLRPGSYGSMEIRPSVRNEFIGQPIDYSEESGVKTRLFTIDSLALPRVDFIKIDIEGMEMEALAGAMGTIRKFRPQMIIEKIKSDETALRNLLIAEGYRVAPFTGNLVAIHGSDPSHEQLLA
jgi:FkbM family methyltransferase